MRRVAFATLRHDALRTVLLVLGLATAWALVTVQLGLRRGFEESSRALLDRAGGDLWIGARGAHVIDDGEPVLASALAPPHACETRRRPLIVDYTQARRPDGSLVTVQVVGVDRETRGRIPWNVQRGDVAEPTTEAGAAEENVGIDAADADKLGLASDGFDAVLPLRTKAQLRVRTTSTGARSFTQTPYLFLDVDAARRVLGIPANAATFWIVDLQRSDCADEVSRALERDDVDVHRQRALADSTMRHWVEGSGIGALLGIGISMAALVGGAALLLSTTTIVRTYLRELATIRALGATRGELASFVAWQVGFVSALAAALALALAWVLAVAMSGTGLTVIVDAESALAAVAVAALATALASAVGARTLGRMDPREVLE